MYGPESMGLLRRAVHPVFKGVRKMAIGGGNRFVGGLTAGLVFFLLGDWTTEVDRSGFWRRGMAAHRGGICLQSWERIVGGRWRW